MRYYDVFNGDADGICALRQLRLADPLDATLVTGLKRDIALLQSVPAVAGDVVTVLDISLDRNRFALDDLLGRGAVVHYFDHHYAGDLPKHPALLTVIDDSGESCTSVLVDRYLQGRFRAWAVVGAFGDGFDEAAIGLARSLGFDAMKIEQLRELGINLNYSAYGENEAEVLVPPATLYRIASHYADPFELIANEPVIERLGNERVVDLERALATRALHATPSCDAWFLPDEPWARRVIGTFANRLSLLQPHHAHAVFAPCSDGTLTVSVRSPRGRGPQAAEFCRRFPGGGGRATAGGVDHLEAWRIDSFLEAFDAAWRMGEHAAA